MGLVIFLSNFFQEEKKCPKNEVHTQCHSHCDLECGENSEVGDLKHTFSLMREQEIFKKFCILIQKPLGL